MRARHRRVPDGRFGTAALSPTAASVAIALAAGYVALAFLVWIAQERLIFLGAGAAPDTPAPEGWRTEAVEVSARDGVRLRGTLVLPPQGSAPLVIYYGGNAEEVTARARDVAATYGPVATLLVNYRGYGRSEGRASEASLVADALEIHDAIAKRPDIDRTRIALHGRSLGSGVAVAVAASRPVRCVVLTSPFASARDVAIEAYPWLPVRWMLRHPFDSHALAPRVSVPLLVLVGSADDIIAPRHSEKLARAWGGPVERQSFAGFGHNDLDLHPGYAQAIRAFLARTLVADSQGAARET